MQILRSTTASLNPNAVRNIADDRLKLAATRFNLFRKKIKTLRQVLQDHHSNLIKTQVSRSKIVQSLKDVGEDSPIFNIGGNIGEADLSRLVSFTTVESDYGREMSCRLEKYQRDHIQYCKQWESTVTTRVATELAHVDKLYRTFERYHFKVENLKAAAEKKKSVRSSDRTKISRNESKLRTARKEYKRNLASVTLLVEEVTDRGWKDLIPLMIRLMDYDIITSQRTATLLEPLVHVKQEMEILGERYEMTPEEILNGRLDVLQEQDAFEFANEQDIDSVQASVSTYGDSSKPIDNALDSPMAGSHKSPVSSTEENDSSLEDDDDDPMDDDRNMSAHYKPSVLHGSDGIELNAHTPVKRSGPTPKRPVTSRSVPRKSPRKTTSGGPSPRNMAMTRGANSRPRPTAPPGPPSPPRKVSEDFPSSIYMDGDETFHIFDDETTLTPYPDLASC